jgi:hypothetical protein
MVAGDAYLQEEILQGVQEDIAVRIAERPNEWIPIRDIARLYRTRCDAACRVKAEAAILVPLGITSETFLTRQHEFAESFVTKLANELYNFEAPRVEVRTPLDLPQSAADTGMPILS